MLNWSRRHAFISANKTRNLWVFFYIFLGKIHKKYSTGNEEWIKLQVIMYCRTTIHPRPDLTNLCAHRPPPVQVPIAVTRPPSPFREMEPPASAVSQPPGNSPEPKRPCKDWAAPRDKWRVQDQIRTDSETTRSADRTFQRTLLFSIREGMFFLEREGWDLRGEGHQWKWSPKGEGHTSL